jgi:threonine/homoserine/homoserine lactone efflux protein
MTAAALSAIWFVHLLAVISPGPAILMAARTGLTQGAARGVALAFGLGLGACIWASAAIFGLKLLFEWAPSLLIVLRLGGAAYLIWLAVQLWRGASTPLSDAGDSAKGSGWAVFRRGLATQLANPKPAVFFGAIFANLIPPNVSPLLWLGLLGIIMINEVVWNSLVARIFAISHMKRAYLGLKSTIDRVFAGLLGLLGVKLALG